MSKWKIGVVVLLTMAATPAFAKGGSEINLTALWIFGDDTVNIVQNGPKVEGTMKKVTPQERKNYGWKNGDSSFRGDIKRKRLRGQMRVLYPLDLKRKCGIWEKWVPFKATITQDSISGKWWSETVSAAGCRVTEEGWVDFTMTRKGP